MPIEENGTPLDSIEQETSTTDVAEPEKVEASTEPDPAQERADRLAKLPDTFREALGEETENPELDELLLGLTPEKIKELDPVLQSYARALLRNTDAAAAKAKADFGAREAAFVARETKLKQAERAHEQRRAALLEQAARAAAAVKDKPAPKADPFTDEGRRELAAHEARTAVAEAFEPLIAERERVRQEAVWTEITDAYPALLNKDGTPSKIGLEFDAFMAEANKGVDRSKGQAPHLTAEVGVELFFARRARAERAAATTTEAAQRQAERNRAAAAVGSGRGGGGVPSPLDRYNALKKQNPEAAEDLLFSDPAVSAAYKAHYGIAA